MTDQVSVDGQRLVNDMKGDGRAPYFLDTLVYDLNQIKKYQKYRKVSPFIREALLGVDTGIFYGFEDVFNDQALICFDVNNPLTWLLRNSDGILIGNKDLQQLFYNVGLYQNGVALPEKTIFSLPIQILEYLSRGLDYLIFKRKKTVLLDVLLEFWGNLDSKGNLIEYIVHKMEETELALKGIVEHAHAFTSTTAIEKGYRITYSGNVLNDGAYYIKGGTYWITELEALLNHMQSIFDYLINELSLTTKLEGFSDSIQLRKYIGERTTIAHSYMGTGNDGITMLAFNYSERKRVVIIPFEAKQISLNSGTSLDNYGSDDAKSVIFGLFDYLVKQQGNYSMLNELLQINGIKGDDAIFSALDDIYGNILDKIALASLSSAFYHNIANPNSNAIVRLPFYLIKNDHVITLTLHETRRLADIICKGYDPKQTMKNIIGCYFGKTGKLRHNIYQQKVMDLLHFFGLISSEFTIVDHGDIDRLLNIEKIYDKIDEHDFSKVFSTKIKTYPKGILDFDGSYYFYEKKYVETGNHLQITANTPENRNISAKYVRFDIDPSALNLCCNETKLIGLHRIHFLILSNTDEFKRLTSAMKNNQVSHSNVSLKKMNIVVDESWKSDRHGIGNFVSNVKKGYPIRIVDKDDTCIEIIYKGPKNKVSIESFLMHLLLSSDRNLEPAFQKLSSLKTILIAAKGYNTYSVSNTFKSMPKSKRIYGIYKQKIYGANLVIYEDQIAKMKNNGWRKNAIFTMFGTMNGKRQIVPRTRESEAMWQGIALEIIDKDQLTKGATIMAIQHFKENYWQFLRDLLGCSHKTGLNGFLSPSQKIYRWIGKHRDQPVISTRDHKRIWDRFMEKFNELLTIIIESENYFGKSLGQKTTILKNKGYASLIYNSKKFHSDYARSISALGTGKLEKTLIPLFEAFFSDLDCKIQENLIEAYRSPKLGNIGENDETLVFMKNLVNSAIDLVFKATENILINTNKLKITN